MITFSQGIYYALIAMAASVYLGFFIRLILIEKIRHPVSILITTYFFTLFLVIHLSGPFFSLLIAVVDKEIRFKEGLVWWRNLFSYIVVVILSPFMGVKYLLFKTPRDYNLLFPQLHRIIYDLHRGFKIIQKQSKDSMFSDMMNRQTNNLFELRRKLSH